MTSIKFKENLASGDTTAVATHLDAHPDDIFLSDIRSGFPVHIAARAGQWAMLRLLEDRGANMTVRDEGEEEHFAGNETIFHAAAQGLRKNPGFMTALIERYGTIVSIDAENSEGQTAMAQALKRGLHDTVRELACAGALLPVKPWPETDVGRWLQGWEAALESERLLSTDLPKATKHLQRRM